MGTLLYGSGLRLMECLRLRIKDVDIGRSEVLVREGKGNKDRVTMLPSAVVSRLSVHLEWVRKLYAADLAAGMDASRFTMPWRTSTRRRTANGVGSGSFPRQPSRPTRARASGAGITCTSPCRSVPSVKQNAASASRNRLGRTRCATASPHICWKRATCLPCRTRHRQATFARSRSCSGTVT